MPRIERYTRGVVKPRAVADTVNPRAIADADAPFDAAAEISGFAAERLDKIVQAQEEAAVSDAVINAKKQKMKFLEQARMDNAATPEDFADRMSHDLKKIDEEFAANLPTSRSKNKFKEEMSSANLRVFESNFEWSIGRRVAIGEDKIKDGQQNLNNLAYDAAVNGHDLDPILADARNLSESAGLYVPPESRDNVRREITGSAKKSYILGLVDSNPEKAISLIDNGDFSGALGAKDRFSLRRSALVAKNRNDRKNKELKNEVSKRQEKINDEFISGNYAEAAALSLIDEEVSQPTAEQLIAKQAEMGLQEPLYSVMTKKQAKHIAAQLENTSGPEEFKSVYNAFLSQYKTEEAREVASQDLVRNGGLSPAADLIISNNVLSGGDFQGQLGDRVSTNLFRIMSEASSVENAKKDIKEMSHNGINFDKAENVLSEQLQRLRSHLVISGENPVEAEGKIAALRDAFLLAMRDQASATGSVSEDDVQGMFDSFGEYSYEYGFPVRKDALAVYSERDFESATSEVIESSNILLPFTKEENPDGYESFLRMVKRDPKLSYAGEAGGEDVYYIKDHLGADYIYEKFEQNGQIMRKPLVLTLQDVLLSKNKKRSEAEKRGAISVRAGTATIGEDGNIAPLSEGME